MGDTQADVGELTRLLDGAAKQREWTLLRAAVAAMFARDGLEAPIWSRMARSGFREHRLNRS